MFQICYLTFFTNCHICIVKLTTLVSDQNISCAKLKFPIWKDAIKPQTEIVNSYKDTEDCDKTNNVYTGRKAFTVVTLDVSHEICLN